jgi:hypothetical protein
MSDETKDVAEPGEEAAAGPVIPVELIRALRDVHRLRMENMLLTGMVMGLALALWISRERMPY